jgi:hypothetical protein
MEIKGALTISQSAERKAHSENPRIACLTCELRSYKAGSLLRCLDWKRHTTITCCSNYVGPHAECHFKVAGGPDWHDTLAHAGIKK